jgi:hypothetical protein
MKEGVRKPVVVNGFEASLGGGSLEAAPLGNGGWVEAASHEDSIGRLSKSLFRMLAQ